MCALFKKRNYLHLLEFDTSGYEYAGEDIDYPGRFWRSDKGILFGLQFFNERPDLPKPLDNEQLLFDYYLQSGVPYGTGLIEVNYQEVNELDVVRVIGKKQLENQRKAYLGSITIPFSSFYFIFHVHFAEYGVTGSREALFRFLYGGGKPIPEEDWFVVKIEGLPPPLWKNQSENADFDEKIPKHSLSLVREILKRIESTIHVKGKLRTEQRYSIAA